MIYNAPISFGVAVLAIAGLIWWAMSWGYGREINLLKQQVIGYKDKLSAVFPNGAKPKEDAMRVSFNGYQLEVSAVLGDAESVDLLVKVLQANKVLLPASAKNKIGECNAL